jgi:hypothetical protein
MRALFCSLVGNAHDIFDFLPSDLNKPNDVTSSQLMLLIPARLGTTMSGMLIIAGYFSRLGLPIFCTGDQGGGL